MKNERQTYDMDSAFDIKKHKLTFINYFEAILLPSGEVQYATPSHVEKLIKITGESRDVIWDKIAHDRASPIEWLVAYTSCVALWSAFYIGKPQTAEQEHMLRLLIEHGLTKRRR